ncbi:PRC-barrel domain-containing protein [Streptomyces sp. NPDC056411]|uniref:PRC-barrel domain-containing protein n=1 Tax=Streptomyces sp. NPDC056411 TaxID=3345813 RepID=UPI0035D9C41B
MNTPQGDTPHTLTGLQVVDADGVKVGTVQQVYRDDATNDPEWITVRTGLFGLKETFIPLAGARRSGGDLHVPHRKETIRRAPRIDAHDHLDPSEEEELYRHYGLDRAGGDDRALAPDVAGDHPRTVGVADPGAPARATADPKRSATEPDRPAPPRGERNKLFDAPAAGAAASRDRGPGDGGPGSEKAGHAEEEAGTDDGRERPPGPGPDRSR